MKIISKVYLTIFLVPIPLARAQEDPLPSPISLEINQESTLALDAFWDPIETSYYKLHESNEILRDLGPEKASKDYELNAFSVFLPKAPVSVGDIWDIEMDGVISILKQLNAGAQSVLHHHYVGVPGGRGSLRAMSDEFADIAVRVHADFLLSDGSSYFTPSQFAGRLVIDRSSGEIVVFNLRIPSRNSNFDVNVTMNELSGRGGAADIGFAPRVELVYGDVKDLAEIEWHEEMKLEDMELHLAKAFYPYLETPWLDFEDAVDESQRTGKPLHAIVLFGTLDDESC